MSEREDFLARWSRRKRQSVNDVEKEQPATTEQTANNNQSIDKQKVSQSKEPLFDLTTLPPLESISAGTDIRAFLAPGVPAELTRVALRRAWAAEPAIRDFIGLADYAWDFNAPGAMAGFGPLEMTDELRREVVGMLTRGQRSDEQALTVSPPPENLPLEKPPSSPETLAPESELSRDASVKAPGEPPALVIVPAS